MSPTEIMDIEYRAISAEGYEVPAICITPDLPRGATVILPGYGGNKEEFAGLGWRVAEAGLAACIIDFRGHGNHPLPLDTGICNDVEAAIRFSRQFGPVIALGHSLGGRLALVSSADFHIAISPSLTRTYSERTNGLLKTLRGYRVHPPDLGAILAVQEALPVWEPQGTAPDTLLIYGERDVPEIAEGCRAFEERGIKTVMVPGGLHNDIFLLEPVFAAVNEQIVSWYGSV